MPLGSVTLEYEQIPGLTVPDQSGAIAGGTFEECKYECSKSEFTTQLRVSTDTELGGFQVQVAQGSLTVGTQSSAHRQSSASSNSMQIGITMRKT